MPHSDAKPLRVSILGLLDTIGDLKAQIDYEKNVPSANVPAELVCTWFDDLYHPASKRHAKAFSIRERQLLARFHAAFESVAHDLPCDGGVSALQATPEWIALSKEATSVASEMRGAS